MICSDTPNTQTLPFPIGATNHPGDNYPSTAALPDGGFVTVWMHGNAVMGQRYDDAGQTVGAEFTVADATSQTRDYPSVTLLADGSLLMAWQASDIGPPSAGHAMIRHYDALGIPTGPETLLNLNSDSGYPRPESIGAMSSGNYVVAFPNQSFDISMQIFDSNDAPITSPVTVNTTTSGGQWGPEIAIADDNSFVIVWISQGQTNDNEDIYGQRFNADGTPAGAEFIVAENTTGSQFNPNVIYLSNGDFVVSWDNFNPEGDISFQRFDSAGTPLGGETLASPMAASDSADYLSSLLALPDGGFVIAWSHEQSGGDIVQGQRFDANGDPVGDQFSFFGEDTNMSGHASDMVLLSNGDVAFIASGYYPTLGGYDIYGRIITVATEVLGTAGPDTMTGTPNSDWLSGLAGDDEITGNGSDDCLFGGDGNDIVRGLDGADHLDGGADDDRIFGASGDDLIFGGTGVDYLRGGGGIDTIYGHGGADDITGGGLDDFIYGGGGKDVIKGGSGDDFIWGGGGKDTILGKQGDDGISGGKGADSINAGGGDDLVVGGKGADVILGKGGNDELFGQNGADTIKGGGGDDIVGGGKGSDALYGGAGSDLLFANDTGLTGTDTQADALYGGKGNDGLNGGHGDDLLVGGIGDDYLFGSLGQDTLRGGDGADTFTFRNAAESPTGATNSDIIEDFSVGIDTIDLGEIEGLTAFTFIGGAGFSGTAMELNAISNGSETIVQADIDGDGIADMSIELTGNLMLSASDFIL